MLAPPADSLMAVSLGSAGRRDLPKHGYPRGVSAEVGDVVSDPFEGHPLVLKACVLRNT